MKTHNFLLQFSQNSESLYLSVLSFFSLRPVGLRGPNLYMAVLESYIKYYMVWYN